MKNVQWFNHENDTDSQTILMKKILAKTIWVISTARNAIIVVICTILAYGCDPGFEFDTPRAVGRQFSEDLKTDALWTRE